MSFSLSNMMIPLLNTIGNLFIFILMLRFALHLARADYYNPITQSILKATNWLVAPLQRFLKPWGRFDIASFLAAIIVKFVVLALIIYLLAHALPPVANLLWGALAGTINALVKIYYFALIIMIVLSWIAPNATHPGALLVSEVTQPVLAPLQKIIPPLGMLDLSPIVAFLLINFINMFVINALINWAQLPGALLVGF